MTVGDQEGQGGADTANAGDADTSSAPDSAAEIANLRSLVGEQAMKIDRLIDVLSATAPKPVQPDFNELVKTDMGGAIQLAVQQTVNRESARLDKTLAVRTYNEKLEKEYPQVNSDKTFRDLTVSTMKELVDSGEYTKDSPALPYRAAQIAAHKYKPKASQTGAGGMSGEAPKSSSGGKTAGNQQTDSGFEAWMKVFGGMIKDKDGMRAKYEAHKRGGRS